jgi:hypothetical protein
MKRKLSDSDEILEGQKIFTGGLILSGEGN